MRGHLFFHFQFLFENRRNKNTHKQTTQYTIDEPNWLTPEAALSIGEGGPHLKKKIIYLKKKIN